MIIMIVDIIPVITTYQYMPLVTFDILLFNLLVDDHKKSGVVEHKAEKMTPRRYKAICYRRGPLHN